MPLARCPECQADIDLLPMAEVGETVECDDCGIELEVAGIDPLVFKDFEFMGDEDDEDDEDDGW